MAGELLTLDASGSNVDGTDPGTALNIGPGTLYGLRAFDAPAPAQTFGWAGSVDTEGALPATRKHENRQISVTVLCTTAAALKTLQVKVGKIAREGGTLKWVLPTADTVIFDLHSADTFAPRIDKLFYVRTGGYCEVQLTLLARPYGRGAEEDLGDNVETTLPVLIFTDTGVKGDVPGLGRLLIDEDQGAAQRTLLWGVQSHYYDSLADLFFQAESGGTGSTAISAVHAAVGTSVVAGASGSGSNTMRDLSLVTAWSDPNSYQFKTASRHVGTFRVYARIAVPNTNTGTVSLRTTWRNANDPYTDNDAVTVDPTYENSWVLVDLGQVGFRVPYHGGTADNEINFRAISTVAGDDVYWDWVMLLPVDEGSGIATTTDALLSSPMLSASSHLQVSDIGAFTASTVSPLSDAVWSRVPIYEGSYFTVPPAGTESRTVRVMVKASRGRPLTANSRISVTTSNADAGTDDISAHLYYTPRYLVVPSS